MFVGTNGVVLDEGGRILLMRRDDTLTWALPGGGLEAGELPPAGVAREVEEETGQRVAPQRLVGLYQWAGARKDYLIFVFRCLPTGGELQTTEEAIQVAYHRPDRLPWPMLSLHRERIGPALAHGGGWPVWTRQQPSLWLGVAQQTIGRFIHWRQDRRQRRESLPPYQPPRPWKIGAFTIIRDDHGRVLWVKRMDYDVWNLPGGGLELGETPWETAVRETREETGLSVRLTGLSGVYVKPADQSLVFAFLAEVVAGQLTTGREAADFDFFAPGQEPRNSLPKQVERAADAAAGHADAIFRIQDGPPGLEQLGLRS